MCSKKKRAQWKKRTQNFMGVRDEREREKEKDVALKMCVLWMMRCEQRRTEQMSANFLRCKSLYTGDRRSYEATVHMICH